MMIDTTTKTFTILIVSFLLLLLSYIPIPIPLMKKSFKLLSLITIIIFIYYHYLIFKKRTISFDHELEDKYRNKSILMNYTLIIACFILIIYIISGFFA